MSIARQLKFGLAVSAVAFFANPVESQAITYNAASEFSSTKNPNGPWVYGSSTKLGGALKPYVLIRHDKLDYWHGGGSFTTPNVVHNGSGRVVNAAGYLKFPNGAMSFHPGRYGDYSIIRWTAPQAGTYKIDATFTGANPYGSTTDVHVLNGATDLFTAYVNGFGDTWSYRSGNITLTAKQTIDFAIGWGKNRNFSRDTTFINALISSVQPPAPIGKAVRDYHPSLFDTGSEISHIPGSDKIFSAPEPSTLMLTLMSGLAGFMLWTKKRLMGR